MFERPSNFVTKVERGKHIVLFYEEPEYAQMILFEFIKNGLNKGERCVYVSEEDKEIVKREMSDAGINVDQFTKNDLLSIHQIPNLVAQQIPETILERLAQITAYPWTKKEDKPDRIALSSIFNTDIEEQIGLNLKWEIDHRYGDLKGLQGTMICTYPVNNIIATISESGSYGKWMSELLEIYDGVIFARKFWKGVALSLS